MGLRIEVDHERCMGSGNCTFHAPATFDLNDDLKSAVVDAAGDPPERIRLAAEGCPTGAITVEEAS
ncbi:MAG: ferredoxin [Acidimicrobiales bacterium]